MVILGLTGSIAMGKTTAAAMFARLGIPVFDADAAVHALLAPGGAGVFAVDAVFPGVVKGGSVDRPLLAERVFGSASKLRRLEMILHPLVGQAQRRFLETAARHRRRLVVLDVPLLFETGGERHCDRVAVVSAPPFLQMQRLLGRPGMTHERVQATLSRQMPDREKCRRADFVIPSGQGRAVTYREIERIAERCRRLQARHWPPWNLRPRQSHGERRVHA